MSTSPFPSTFPSLDQFPQGMDFLKQFWAQGAAAPSAGASSATPAFQQAIGQYFLPTFDLEELDKRINDLRTVLQFMELNTQMVRQSLNSLEVQRNTVATLHSMAQPKPTGDAPNTAAPPWMAAWQQMMQPAAPVQAKPNPKPSTKPVVDKKPVAKKTPASAKKSAA